MDWADILIMFTIYSSQIFNNFYIRDPFDLNIHVKNQKRSCFFFVFNVFIIFGCVGSLLLHVGFLQLQRSGATLCCGARASHCNGFSCCGAWALGMWASVVTACGLSSCGARALEHRLSSCGAQTQLLRDMWDLPGPGLEPVSPALAGGSLTTMPPVKPGSCFYQ